MMGDTRIASDHYPDLQLYINFMMTKVNETGIGSLYQNYGDWCPPGNGGSPPKSYTSGVALLQDLQRMAELATALGLGADAAQYASWRSALVGDFNEAWEVNGTYGGGSGVQTCNAAALFLATPATPAATAAVRSVLAKDVLQKERHWSTGIIGMRFLHSALTEAGNGSMAIDTLLQSDYPSFGYWFSGVDETAATTLWELPNAPNTGPGMNSRNHVSHLGLQRIFSTLAAAGGGTCHCLACAAVSLTAFFFPPHTLTLPFPNLPFCSVTAYVCQRRWLPV